jgi:hypothetical protein
MTDHKANAEREFKPRRQKISPGGRLPIMNLLAPRWRRMVVPLAVTSGSWVRAQVVMYASSRYIIARRNILYCPYVTLGSVSA